jgi:DNA-binding transcriptional ArsR family regulator
MRHARWVPTDLFEVVVEPNRRRILDALREGDRSVGDLVDLLDIAQPTVSKHLKALREAGLVVVRPDAQRRWYQLRPEPLRELDAWIEPYRTAWAERLDALARHLNRTEEK